MKALTLTQPWAQLVADDRKHWETRSWPTWYRGILAIHAGKGDDSIDRALAEHFGYKPARDMPRGAIVAIVRVTDCQATLGDDEAFRDEAEYDYGYFERGRWKFRLELVTKLEAPVPCRGALGIWDVPADVAALIEAQL
jgi:hypothetical protein